MPGARRDLRRGRLLRRPGPRPRRDDPLLDEGLAELVRWWRPPPSTRPDSGRRPAHRPRARLLHRHGLRDAAARLRAVRLDLLGRPLRQPGLDGRATYPGVGISIGVTRLLGLVFGRGLVTASRSVPDLRAGRRRPTRTPPLRRPHRRRPAGARHRHRGRPLGGQVRQADPLRRAARHPVRLVRRRRRRARQVKDIRSGEQSPADPETWSPPAADLVPQLEEPTP